MRKSTLSEIQNNIIGMTAFVILLTAGTPFTYGRPPLSIPPDRLEMAQNRCDSLPICDIEGVWKFPEDNLIVLILTDETNPQNFNIEVVESDDCRVRHGDIIGYVEPTINASKFIIHLCSSVDKGIIKHPHSCVATLDSRKEALTIQRSKLKISINPLGFLPYFWRSIRIRRSDPVKETERGLIRIYPSYDGNGSSQRKPRYL